MSIQQHTVPIRKRPLSSTTQEDSCAGTSSSNNDSNNTKQTNDEDTDTISTTKSTTTASATAVETIIMEEGISGETMVEFPSIKVKQQHEEDNFVCPAEGTVVSSAEVKRRDRNVDNYITLLQQKGPYSTTPMVYTSTSSQQHVVSSSPKVNLINHHHQHHTVKTPRHMVRSSSFDGINPKAFTQSSPQGASYYHLNNNGFYSINSQGVAATADGHGCISPNPHFFAQYSPSCSTPAMQQQGTMIHSNCYTTSGNSSSRPSMHHLHHHHHGQPTTAEQQEQLIIPASIHPHSAYIISTNQPPPPSIHHQPQLSIQQHHLSIQQHSNHNRRIKPASPTSVAAYSSCSSSSSGSGQQQCLQIDHAAEQLAPPPNDKKRSISPAGYSKISHLETPEKKIKTTSDSTVLLIPPPPPPPPQGNELLSRPPSFEGVTTKEPMMRGRKTIVARFLCPNNCEIQGTPIVSLDSSARSIRISGIELVYHPPPFSQIEKTIVMRGENGSIDIRVPLMETQSLNNCNY